MNTNICYSISHPITKDVVYVGRTSREFEKRMWEHYRKASNLKLRAFMDDLKSKKLLPLCEILKGKDGLNTMLEEQWINHFIKLGHTLFNEQCGTKPSYNPFKSYIKNRNEIDPLVSGFIMSLTY